MAKKVQFDTSFNFGANRKQRKARARTKKANKRKGGSFGS